jgi:hypothetical protein
MEDTANKKPSKECKAPPMVARLGVRTIFGPNVERC